jgi:L-ectoine synthase
VIIRKKEDVVGTKGDASGERWHSFRLLHQEDGMHVTLTDSILEAGFEMQLWQKNHFEACYCIEGEGTVEEVDTGTVHDIRAGTLYAMNNHDRHRIKAITQMRIEGVKQTV